MPKEVNLGGGTQGQPQDNGRTDSQLPRLYRRSYDVPSQEQLRRHILEGRSQFARFIRPVAERLFELPEDRQTESLETFRLIYDFIKGKDLSGMDFTLEDSIFMLTDRVGYLLRRPVIHTSFAQKVDDAIKIVEGDEKEGKVKALFVTQLRANAWSKFVGEGREGLRSEIEGAYREEGVYLDYFKNADEFKEAIKECPVFAAGLSRMSWEIADEMHTKFGKPAIPYYEYDRAASRDFGGKKRFINDPDHAYGMITDVSLYRTYINNLMKPISIPPLVREASFMLVEDNPIHTLWTELLNYAKGLSRYTPAHDTTKVEGRAGVYEGRGVYHSAERALEVIGEKGKPPDIVLADIELGEGMNGLELVEELHKRHPKMMILMVYSSNPGPWMEEIERLSREGIIKGSWHKREFTPTRMIETVNRELKNRVEIV